MDLLVEKLDGSRYYLSQYKVLITEFEESAPSVTRNSKQLNQRNGNIDFGGWHTDKTINITGYYRADDVDEEEALRERLYALLSDPNGYYITQLKTTSSVAMERPGETSGGYYDKLKDYPSHKRFLVYTEAPEMELVGNVGGTLLYKLTAEFKTMKLPYGETVTEDINLPGKYANVPVNLYKDTQYFAEPDTWVYYTSWTKLAEKYGDFVVMQANTDWNGLGQLLWVKAGETYTFSAFARYASGTGTSSIFWLPTNNDGQTTPAVLTSASLDVNLTSEWQRISSTTTVEQDGYIMPRVERGGYTKNTLQAAGLKLGHGTAASWTPNPAELEYDLLDGTSAIPYTGTVPCNQLEQGFSIQLTATGSASSLSFKVDDTELTYSNAVAAGDVILLSGFSYTQNGLSIVNKTNKAYFILQPDKPNKITCNVPGTVRILGFQNLYA